MTTNPLASLREKVGALPPFGGVQGGLDVAVSRADVLALLDAESAQQQAAAGGENMIDELARRVRTLLVTNYTGRPESYADEAEHVIRSWGNKHRLAATPPAAPDGGAVVEPGCAGPFSDAYDCLVHSPAKRAPPPAQPAAPHSETADTLRADTEKWLRDHGPFVSKYAALTRAESACVSLLTRWLTAHPAASSDSVAIDTAVEQMRADWNATSFHCEYHGSDFHPTCSFCCLQVVIGQWREAQRALTAERRARETAEQEHLDNSEASQRVYNKLAEQYEAAVRARETLEQAMRRRT